MSEFVAGLAETHFTDEETFTELAVGEIAVNESLVSESDGSGSFNSAV